MFNFYKPKWWIVIVDLLLITVNVLFVFLFLPLTSSTPFQKYAIPLLIFSLVWVLLSYFLHRYKPLLKQTFFKSIFRLFLVSLLSFIIFGGFILIQPASPYSEYVLVTILIGIFLAIYLFIFLFTAVKYATQYETPIIEKADSELGSGGVDALPLSIDAINERKNRIVDFSGDRVYQFLDKNSELFVSSTFIMSAGNSLENNLNTYNQCIQLKRLNHIRGINAMLATANERLGENGLLICCYKSQTTTKQTVFRKYPRVIADIIYFGHFMVHRFFPKVFLTSRLYLDFTDGKNRTLSKTEVLGRINYCGFKVEREAKIGFEHYVFARKIKPPEPLTLRRYGLLIKLKRHGKNGKMFNVYKFRTMHPYAEFLQEYIYEKSNLAEGGKFKRDIRVTTLGKFMRKYWLDELPMLYNLLKGDMKLVGVRPLSAHYFSLYSEELQQMRINHKPGLLPPFYADMPKTLEEIEQSEIRYLQACEERGTFGADLKYFFLIIRNILFRKARSA